MVAPEKGGRNGGFRRHAKRALLYLLPWWILVPVIAVLLHGARVDAELTPIREAEAIKVRGAMRGLHRTVDQLSHDIRLLSRVVHDLGPDPGAVGWRDAVAGFMVQFLGTFPDYSQARFLDNACREIVRVDRKGAELVRTPPEALQDKSGRDYCVAGQALKTGQAYVSRLDANIEHGRVVFPIEPTLRIIARVSGDAMGPGGMVILNLDATSLLARFRLTDRQTLSLLDDAGYWLHSPDAADEMAFARGDSARRMPVRHPHEWQRIVSGGEDTAQFELSSGLWTSLVFVAREGEKSLISPTLYVVGFIPEARLEAIRVRSAQTFWLLGGSVIMVVTVLTLALARARFRMSGMVDDLARQDVELAEAGDLLKASRDELVRSERLSSLGLMVAGVAHELNTPIGAAMMAGGVLKEQLDAFRQACAAGLRRSDLAQFDGDHAEALSLLEANLQRAAHLIKLFKQVATERASVSRERFDLAQLVDDVVTLMGGALKRTPHSVECAIEPGLQIDGYPGPLGQIVQNLVQNAVMHAFPQGRVGHIEIGARRDGSWIRLWVRDDGCGIPREDAERVWDPFYTTGRNRGGTGLGLHICHKLAVDVLGGCIDIATSGESSGTTFEVRFPCVAPGPDAESGNSTPGGGALSSG
ncbi:sensor histidine kinase [Cognatazoarcus halotolerans]|uniref:sensor histidine kinase n=1 Tax=Cognatazoarcus halotolerans TaxID=2686016 RepID=UPI00135A9DDA|nr:HAMP domain-containing sensor histidine kinase [Cognatazoarcus halotolerans]MBX3680621.1 HAMP domain-containing histidine kinase [Rhodocyclaceae bacterium]MCB1898718.1 HAMP domain-containing histidine kinase [Rhodocyclaceae bacterium]MCP5310462.1 HAMP domain-containing histidine kinase [Zoogloeaceae bacterium]